MRYQLVVQFETADSLDDFDRLVRFEGKLAAELRKIAEVDGHDFGSSEFNVFILTDTPKVAFETAHRLVLDQKLRYPMRAAYRELTEEAFVILWPSTLREFRVS